MPPPPNLPPPPSLRNSELRRTPDGIPAEIVVQSTESKLAPKTPSPAPSPLPTGLADVASRPPGDMPPRGPLVCLPRGDTGKTVRASREQEPTTGTSDEWLGHPSESPARGRHLVPCFLPRPQNRLGPPLLGAKIEGPTTRNAQAIPGHTQRACSCGERRGVIQ